MPHLTPPPQDTTNPWSTPPTWSTLTLYAFITAGILIVLLCLWAFMYELSDQYRTARFVAVDCEYRDDIVEEEELGGIGGREVGV